jgi:hypothetical protein
MQNSTCQSTDNSSFFLLKKELNLKLKSTKMVRYSRKMVHYSHTLQVILGNDPGLQQQLHRRPGLTAAAAATAAVPTAAAAAGARIDVDAADAVV